MVIQIFVKSTSTLSPTSLNRLEVLGHVKLGVRLLLDLVNSDARGQLGKSHAAVLAVDLEYTLRKN